MRGGISRWWQRTMFQPGSADRIARGASLGFFIGWLPLVGVQMVLALGLCAITRSSFLAAVPGVWMSNPFTMVPMYWFINWVGAHIAGRAISWERMQEIWSHVGTLSFTEATRYLFVEVSHATLAMLIGGAIVGLIHAAITYPIVVRMVERYQRHWEERRNHWRTRSGPRVSDDQDSQGGPPNQVA